MTELEMNFDKFKKEERRKRLERSLRLSILKRNGDLSNDNDVMNNPNEQNWSFSFFSESPKANDKSLSSKDNEPKITTTVKEQKYTSYEPRVTSLIDKKSPKQDNSLNVQKVMKIDKDQKYISYESRIGSSNNKKISKQDNCFNNNVPKLMTMEKDQKYITSYESRIVSSNNKNSPKRDNCFNSNVQKVTTTENKPKYIFYEPRIASSSIINESPNKNKYYDENDDDTTLNIYKYKSITTNNPEEKSFMRFYNWKVALNQDYKLIIKGQLESGKIARSKPIIRRLTARSIQSISLHVYHLEGNIVDNKNELPEYINKKFYNGFPEDWENVYSIWQLFVFQNSRPTFRWPTKITDSDDELQSEVTMQSINVDENDSSKNSNKIYDNSKDNITNIETINNVSNFEANMPNLSDVRLSNLMKKVNDIKIFNKENRHEDENCDNIIQCKCIQKKRTLSNILKEDQIHIIVNNLIHKDCPKEYVMKILQLFNCLEDVLSYRIESKDLNKLKIDDDDSGLYSSQLRSRLTSSRTCVPEYQNISPIKKCIDYNNYNTINVRDNSNTILQKQSSNSLQRANENDFEDSESQVYGTPKIVFEKVLENKKASLKYDKQRKRKASTNIIYKDSIKSEKRIKTKDRTINHSYLNDIDNEHNIQYSMSDNVKIKKIDEGMKCNQFEQQNDIKKTSFNQRSLIKNDTNLIKSNYDSSVSVTDDDESELDNMNYFKRSYNRKNNNSETKHVYNISITNDHVESPMINCKKHSNTPKVIKHSVKKTRVTNYH